MIYLLIILFLLIGSAVMAFRVIGHIIGFCLMLILAALMGLAANALTGHHFHDFLTPALAGMLGSCLGVLLFGKHGPVIFRVAILPALAGSAIVVMGLNAFRHFY